MKGLIFVIVMLLMSVSAKSADASTAPVTPAPAALQENSAAVLQALEISRGVHTGDQLRREGYTLEEVRTAVNELIASGQISKLYGQSVVVGYLE